MGKGSAMPQSIFKIFTSRKVIAPIALLAGVIGFAASFIELYDAFGSGIKTRLFPQELPVAPADRYAILIADLENDDDRRTLSRAVTDALKLSLEETGADAPVWIDRLPRTISIGGSGAQAYIEKAEDEARELLAETDAEIVVWGEAVPFVNAYTLRLTAAQSSDFTRYAFDDLQFGAPLLEDLAPLVLGAALAEAGSVDMRDATAGALGPLVARLQPLAQSPPDVFTGDQVRSLRLAYARVATEYGEIAAGQAQLAEVVAVLEKTLEATNREDNPEAWARVQQSLADALFRLGEKGATDALQKSADASKAALTVFTQDSSPVEWALSQQKLGLALFRLGQRGEPDALNEAVAAYYAAMTVLTEQAEPQQWASLQNNLGIALLEIAKQGQSDAFANAAFRKSIEAYEAAMRVWTREAAPMDWAKVQNNLGLVFQELAYRGEEGALEDAISAFQEALQVRTREAAPMGWAELQQNLGNALTAHAQNGQAGAYEDAVAAYENAAAIWTREANPAGWASIQYNLGFVYGKLGEQGQPGANEQAIEAYRNTLEVWTRDDAPEDWATTQYFLGLAHRDLGLEEEDSSALNEAVIHFENAAQVITRHSDLRNWILVQLELGQTHTARARVGDRDAVDAALSAFDAALTTIHERNANWASIQTERAEALILKAEADGDPSAARDAVVQLDAAIAVLETAADDEALATARARRTQASDVLSQLETG